MWAYSPTHAARTGRKAVSNASDVGCLFSDDPHDLALDPEQADRTAPGLPGEAIVEPHPVAHDEDRHVARRRGVVDVGGGRHVEERAEPRSHEHEVAHVIGHPRQAGALPPEPLAHDTRLVRSHLRRQGPEREAVVVVAGQLPRHERSVAANPEAGDESRGERQRPPGDGGDAPPGPLPDSSLEARRQLGDRQAPQSGAQGALGLGLRPAPGARLEVRGDGGRRLRLELAVDEAGDALPVAAQRVPPPSASRRSARPRWMRDITVPTGMPRAAAISA